MVFLDYYFNVHTKFMERRGLVVLLLNTTLDLLASFISRAKEAFSNIMDP